MIAAYGPAALAPGGLTYEQYYGLWLNLPRVAMRRAWAVKRGVELALSKADIPGCYYDAVCDTAEEAAELEYRTNAARQEARLKARIGWKT